MKVRLSLKQKTIVESTEGAQLVLASAGSGKTRVLTERIRYLLEHRKAHYKVVGLTFTNKAAEEMRERLSDIVDLSEKAYIGTIHSFCQMMIESHGHTIGYEHPPVIMERESDRMEVMEEVLINNPFLFRYYKNISEEKEKRDYLYNLLNFISKRKRELPGAEPHLVDEDIGEEAAMAFREYNERLEGQGTIDFDDILLLAYRILTERPQVARLYTRTYKYICVDEAQDLNEAQYALIQILAADNGNILMVGDPNQAIYGFNGSDRRFMLEHFPRDFQVEQFEMRENYRSTKAVIHAANTLFPDSMDATRAPLEGLCEIRQMETESEEARWVAAKIKKLLEMSQHPEIDGDISLSRIAVLARNRYVFMPLEKQLKEGNIAFYLKRTGSAWEMESDIGRIFNLGLRILVNPRDRLHKGQLSELLSIDVTRQDALAGGIEQLRSMGERIDDSLRNDFGILLKAWAIVDDDVNRFPQALAAIRDYISNAAENGADAVPEYAMAMQDMEFLADAWRKYTHDNPMERRSLGHFRNQMAMGLTSPREKQKGLALATVHSAKGLEFDIVFLIGMVEGTFPDYRAVRQGGKALEEEKNEAFVAMTRAKRFLFITWPQAKFMPWDQNTRVSQRMSRFISHLPTYTIDHRQEKLCVAEKRPQS
ncbi:ATP-dependent helicase [Thermodesulfobacteriota bacterium]